jgi:hypothetical protein
MSGEKARVEELSNDAKSLPLKIKRLQISETGSVAVSEVD